MKLSASNHIPLKKADDSNVIDCLYDPQASIINDTDTIIYIRNQCPIGFVIAFLLRFRFWLNLERYLVK